MGCPQSKEAHTQDKTEQEFVNLIRRLSLQFRQQSSQFSAKVAQKKQKIVVDINKPLQSRSRIKEQQLLQQLTIYNHFKMMYDYLELQCKYILDRQRYISLLLSTTTNNRLTVSQKMSLLQPIEIILFAISIINDGKINVKNADLAQFQKLVTNNFKDIDVPSTVEHNLLAYYKFNTIPNQGMIKEMAFELCEERNISMSKLQENGHKFKY